MKNYNEPGEKYFISKQIRPASIYGGYIAFETTHCFRYAASSRPYIPTCKSRQLQCAIPSDFCSTRYSILPIQWRNLSHIICVFSIQHQHDRTDFFKYTKKNLKINRMPSSTLTDCQNLTGVSEEIKFNKIN